MASSKRQKANPSSAEQTDNALPPEGGIEKIVAHLARWGRLAPDGLAKVAFDSEFSRQRVIDQLRAVFREANIPFHEIALPANTPAVTHVRNLVEQFRSLEPCVVSLSGFATAFPPDVPLVDSLRVFNFNRENLANHPLRQIWWMNSQFANFFSLAVPDLDSWFIVRLNLTEIVPPPADGQTITKEFGSDYIGIEEAHRISASYVERVKNALAAEASPRQILELADNAITPLLRAGAVAEAGQLQTSLSELMAKSGIAIDDYLRREGSEHISSGVKDGRTINDLAWLYYEQGRYAEAEPLLRQALAVREKLFGPEYPDTATSLNNLAELYRAQGRYAEAEPLYVRALAIREKALGPEHPDTAGSLNNLALLYESQGRYEQAAPLYERALAILEKLLGKDHPNTATVMENYARLLEKLGRVEEAEARKRRQ